MNRRLSNLIYLVMFLLVITIVPVLTLLDSIGNRDLHVIESEAELSFFNGSYSKVAEDHFDRRLSIHDLAVNTMAAVHYFVFDEGASGVVIGKDKWLFSSEEFDLTPNAEENFEINLATIVSVDAYLKKKNITLVITPVPAKARLLRDQLSGGWSQKRRGAYRQLIERLSQNEVHVVDSYAAMNASIPEELFFQSDTHWTPAGADVIAQATAEYCSEKTNLRLADIDYTTEIVGTFALEGDLMSFVPLTPWFSQWGPSLEYFEKSQTYEQSSNLFSPTEINTILVGTSYSADERWNFAGFLKQALGRDLANYSTKGLGPYRPMYDFLTNPEALIDIDLIVWEIPERYLMQSYSELEFSKLLQPQGVIQLATTNFARMETKQ